MFSHHSYLNISLSIWAGLYLFFIIERFLKIFMDAKARKQGEVVNGHGHSHNSHNGTKKYDESLASMTGPEQEKFVVVQQHEEEEEEGKKDRSRSCGGMLQDATEVYSNSQSAIRASFGHQDRPHPATRPTVENVRSLSHHSGNKIATVAWMIIFGDGIHNFIDGLSIGAAFSESILTGMSVSLAVLCEEFPHELGDFAVLLNSGMTVRQAMMYNFLSACTCYLGLVIGQSLSTPALYHYCINNGLNVTGILLGELDGVNVYIFGLAGGMFLYISLVDMVPELNETVERASLVSSMQALATFGLQNIGILIGIVCLYLLARFQDDIQIEL